MDAVANPPPERPLPSEVAASDLYGRNDRERELCAKASRFDWLYLAGTVLADVASIYADKKYFQDEQKGHWRLVGSGLIGVSWGATLSGLTLSLPKCHPHLVPTIPPEGTSREVWPLATVTAMVAAATAPIIVGIETGGVPPNWTVAHQAVRLATASVGAVAGVLLPYVLPPRTWRAAKELQRLRMGPVAQGGGFIGYGFVF